MSTASTFTELWGLLEASPAALAKPLEVRTDVEFHIQALWHLMNVLVKQLEILPIDGEAGGALASINLPQAVRRLEVDLIRRTLIRTRGNQVQAAKFLGLKPTTLNAKIHRYDLQWYANAARSPFTEPNPEFGEGVLCVEK